MPSDSTPAQTDSAAPAAAAAPSVSDSTLQDLSSGAKSMKDLDPAERKLAMAAVRESVMEADNRAAPETEAKSIEKAPEAAKAPEPEAKAKGELPAPVDIKERRRINQRLADEANQLEQKTAALKARQERARKDLEDAQKAEVKPPEDPWDKSHQDGVATELERLKKQVEILTKREVDKGQAELEDATRSENIARENSLYGQFDDLQDEYEPLKTSKPFKELNAVHTSWFDSELIEKSGLRQSMPDASIEQLRAAAAVKYNQDPEFAKTVAPYPITGDDAERFNTLLTLHHETATKGGDLEGNFLALMKRKGLLDEMMQKGRKDAAEDAAKRTVDAIKKQQTTVQPVAPGDGAGSGYIDEGFNITRAQSVQKTLVNKQAAGQSLTPAERETLKKVTAFLTNDFVGAAQ